MKKLIIPLSVFCLTLTFLTTAVAQDSCYRLLKGSEIANGTDPAVLAKMIQDYSVKNPEEAELIVMEFIAEVIQLNNAGQLQPTLNRLVEVPEIAGHLPGSVDTHEERQAVAAQLGGIIEATLISKGLTTASVGKSWPTWETLTSQFQILLDKNFKPEQVEKFNVRSYAFMGALAQLTHSLTPKYNMSSALIDGRSALRTRSRAIQAAKKDINILTWAIYDDFTGEQFRKELCAKRSTGVRIRLIVNGLTAKQPGHGKELTALASCGVQVIRYQGDGDLQKYLGQHRKIMTTDSGNVAVMDSTNPGDHYSHLRPGMTQKEMWHDSGIIYSGPAAIQTNNLFIQIWNQQIQLQDLRRFVRLQPQTGSLIEKQMGHDLMSIINQDPADELPDNVLLAYLAAIRTAKKSIKIKNAYVVRIPSLRQEIVNALQRGVDVQILTNSPESVDEPIVSRPIAEFMQELAGLGANIYLKKGSTLHDKLMIVDDHFMLIGSYNLHPRSSRFEGEVVAAVWGGRSVTEQLHQFEIGIQHRNAEHVTNPANMKLPPDLLNGLFQRLFFDQY